MTFSSILIAREYTPEEKLSQMFMLGFKGSTPQEFMDSISGNHWGGYIFYSQDTKNKSVNITSKKQAVSFLKAIKGHPGDTRIKPFLAIDMEGGLMQLSKGKEDGIFTYFESPQKITSIKQSHKEAWASSIALYMEQLGFNLNLAPIVDVDREPFSNSRCFSGNVNQVIKNSKLFIEKHAESNVLCTLKHFPGRGSGRQKDIATKYNRDIDLKPFQELLSNQNIGLVMISTMTFPSIDPFHPAHKSKQTLDLLRSMGYQKIALTDDVTTKNLTEEKLQAEVLELINAGNDMILFANSGNNYDPQLSKKLRNVVKNIIKHNLISEERLEESFRRILTVKQDHNIEPKEIYLNYDM